ncbi:unnamed protein product [Paramecium pentaurelia]|uniref:Uncharacterized protein n=1 Tax=Paramecium pentaurelia TaxID=43138 RepID=A0A8S1Y0A4_9CILI|nr:unnamed protein product [Paramecium pentaurelia]
MSENQDNKIELYCWISSQILIVVLAIILGCCHYIERRKFKNKLIDFRDIRDTHQYKYNQIDPILAPLNG